MVLLPSITSSNIADLFTKPLSLSRHRFTTTILIGVDPTTPSTSVAPTVAATVVAPTTTTLASDSVPLAPAPLPVIDTGASHSVTSSFASDFTLEVSQASYGLIRSAFDTSNSVASDSKAYSKVVSTPVDPYTLITGEDPTFDLSSLDTTSDSEPSFTKVTFDIHDFGTATLTFVYSRSTSELLRVLLEPTQVDWLHWVPLPRLTPTESYFHIFGCDYPQAFALLHLIPIWIYYLVHSVVNLEE